MDSSYAAVKEVSREKHIIRCKHEKCTWTSPEIWAYNKTEANEIASQIHDTNSDHPLKHRSGRKTYRVVCECGMEVIFKASGRILNVKKIAQDIHDNQSDHELKIKSLNKLE